MSYLVSLVLSARGLLPRYPRKTASTGLKRLRGIHMIWVNRRLG